MVSKTRFVLATCLIIISSLAAITSASASLHPNYYNQVCPEALPTIKRIVEDAVRQERRMGASLLRLHFHDCFVNGCDGSLLLDSTPSFTSEKFAAPNNNSARGFDVIDRIKGEVDRICRRSVVSCADILAVAARDSVVAVGHSGRCGYGRRDSTSASIDTANADIPSPFMDLPALIQSFKKQGLNVKDLVALSGGHTIGFSQCFIFRNRIYNESNIDRRFAAERRATCPRVGGDTNLAALDPTPATFDGKYFGNLIKKKGLLHSDQELFRGGASETDSLVRIYSTDPDAFARDFAVSMVKMGNIKPLTGEEGQIRYNCRRVNSY